MPKSRRITGSFIALTVIFFAVVAGFAYQITQNTKATEALCALRADLDLRINASNELLDENPRGPIFGIPRSVIEMSVTNSRRTRKALSDLNCKEEP
jgi:hypothetical protein